MRRAYLPDSDFDWRDENICGRSASISISGWALEDHRRRRKISALAGECERFEISGEALRYRLEPRRRSPWRPSRRARRRERSQPPDFRLRFADLDSNAATGTWSCIQGSISLFASRQMRFE